MSKQLKESNNQFAFTGIIAELYTWFKLGSEDQQEYLIVSLRDLTDAINRHMPRIKIEEEK